MGHTSSPETLVSYQKMTPCKNPKDFVQQASEMSAASAFSLAL
jgi:hypothetical protein